MNRTQLTEALDQMAVASTDTPLMGFEITIVAAAREYLAFLLDFPTDEMVEAQARRYAEWDGFTFDSYSEEVQNGWRTRAQGDLEAVRRVMYGEEG